ncbi:pancreatic triacylglycerol lipase [Dendroctonus ponderosae]|uniref:Lipase domain-containing protein n=1 Tax=Dendroctonus ponderosae TaxID=77166 RepID=A0AAR5QBC6_DENPD|nr:pancreatic triacylglycerol lipase [Dendroctonus ponderosae]KAH1025755.1 hypothetical protein HUJ05_010420 [Dendroctonus ponderosae]
MNILSFLITTGVNILYTPFAENARSENLLGSNERSIRASDFSIFPFNLLRNTPACSTLNLYFGDNFLKVISIPRGSCSNCCPIKMSRDVKFVLYTKNNPENGITIHPYNENGAARRAGVNPEWKTIIYIHGFSEPSPGESGRGIIDAYLAKPENFNIILLDWGELAAFPWYRTAVYNVKLVGKVLGNFIKLFSQTGEIPIQNLHVVGFSLGSHIASMAGKGLSSGLRIPRITALDPAFPEFSLQDRSKRLAETDADYIDVIHTDAGVFGFPASIGHADFYPNGGVALQPGCQPSYLAQQRIADQVFACSHGRAWRLYAESVTNPRAFPATQCENWKGSNKECNFTLDAFMGFGNRDTVGQFFLQTGFKSPYGLAVKQQIR